MKDNKLRVVCENIVLKKGDRHTLIWDLDLGCSWGTLARISKYYVWIAVIPPVPAGKYNKIDCLEMAEHVGVRNFGKFFKQVYEMLDDDGFSHFSTRDFVVSLGNTKILFGDYS